MDRRLIRRAVSSAIVAVVLVASGLFLAAGCSVYMEATRPTPVDLSEYDIGQSRDSVLERLGSPQNTVVESDGASCDLYQLYTKGYGAGGKIPIAVAEGAADFFTLGLAEIVLTPTEGVTKSEKHPIAFCYKDQKIVRLTTPDQAQTAAIEPPESAPAQAAEAALPVASPAPQSSPVAQVSSATVPAPAVAASTVIIAPPGVVAAPAVPAIGPQGPISAPTASAPSNAGS